MDNFSINVIIPNSKYIGMNNFSETKMHIIRIKFLKSSFI